MKNIRLRISDGTIRKDEAGATKRKAEGLMAARRRKYRPENLVPMFRLAATLCKQMREAEFTDNGGAIHSAERILNILGLCLVYPDLSHINNLRKYQGAEFSVAAKIAYDRGEKVLIEHVSPLRALTRAAIEVIETLNNHQFCEFIKDRFRLVLLTEDEASKLNQHNRTKMTSNRLELAGIVMPPKG